MGEPYVAVVRYCEHEVALCAVRGDVWVMFHSNVSFRDEVMASVDYRNHTACDEIL